MKLPTRWVLSSPEGPYEVAIHPLTRQWWKTLCAMPHAVFVVRLRLDVALQTALVAEDLHHGCTTLATELRQREKILGTTAVARRDLRIRYVSEVDKPADEVPDGAELPAAVASIDARRARLTGTG
ncbi:hypothetical protein [Allorhizocola rhizosphaerae]|uniref:phage terminase small subunit n=1 Tax=Allorhizocola rhizosphaerae TaxID=1872709 RepID=UPI0013C33E43|nr:hypothetical protein [Allorhizocola rhizosphaerae]